MKNKKKIMAVLMAAALATTSMTAFAGSTASSDSIAVSGTSIVEYDNSEEPVLYDVILPTVTDDTYKLIIDRDKVLQDFDKQNAYKTGDITYFKTVGTPSSIKFVSDDAFMFAKEEKAKVTDFKTRMGISANVTTQAGLEAKLLEEKYYIWVPNALGNKTDSTGKFEEITSANYDKVFDITYTPNTTTISAIKITDDFKDKNSTFKVFDGNIYYDKHSVLDDSAAAEFITSGASLGVISENYKKEKLVYTASKAAITGSVTADSKEIKYSPVTDLIVRNSAAAGISKVEYTPAENLYTNKSEDAEIVNRSTTPIAVSAEVSVVSTEGLEFVTKGALDSTTSAAISLGIAFGGSDTASKYVTNGEAKLYYVLGKGYTADMNKYMGDKNQLGAHDYYQYLPSTVADSSATFNLIANVRGDDADTNKSWKAYNKTQVRPNVKVVYSFEAVEQDEENKKKYASIVTDSIFEISSTAANVFTGEATKEGAVASVAPSIERTTYTYTAGSGLEIPVNLGSGTLAATDLSIYHLKKDGVTKYNLVKNTDYTFANSKITFTSEQLAKFTTVDSRVFYITFNSQPEKVVAVTVNK